MYLGYLNHFRHFGNLSKILVDRRSLTSPSHNLLLKYSRKFVRTVQGNIKKLYCVSLILHLEIVLMIVLVLQNFLAASILAALLLFPQLCQLCVSSVHELC